MCGIFGIMGRGSGGCVVFWNLGVLGARDEDRGAGAFLILNEEGLQYSYNKEKCIFAIMRILEMSIGTVFL